MPRQTRDARGPRLRVAIVGAGNVGPVHRRDGLATVTPTEAATESYYESIRAALPDTVWVTGCQSWYLDQHGDPELWPWTPARHRQMLAQPEAAHFVTTPDRGGA